MDLYKAAGITPQAVWGRQSLRDREVPNGRPGPDGRLRSWGRQICSASEEETARIVELATRTVVAEGCGVARNTAVATAARGEATRILKLATRNGAAGGPRRPPGCFKVRRKQMKLPEPSSWRQEVGVPDAIGSCAIGTPRRRGRGRSSLVQPGRRRLLHRYASSGRL